ncbi:MAG: putative pre-16S rRNA nuclease [Syntrophus sp. SKADARSKE-3]|nr:putative pre-16S rRNA nuclease [Syntrophus sp. SKADARSKE-3]
MKILGLDYGESRIGAAVSDETGTMAQGLTTLLRKNRRKDLHELSVMIKTHGIGLIVVGYPRRLDGSEGIQCEKVKRFAALLGRAFQLPVVLWDETLSTKEAEEIMIQAKVHWKKRREMVDRIAASIILQNYLDALQKNGGDKPPECIL